MRVKRYVVDTMPDALQKIRADLGKDAVILNTKQVRSGGFLGLFAKKKIEVIAATDSAQPPTPPPPPVAVKSVPLAAFAGEPEPIAASVRTRPDLATLEEPVLPPPPPVAAPVLRARTKDDLLLEEIKQMKDMMARLSAGREGNVPLPEPLDKCRRLLLEQEVLPELVERIIGRAAEQFADEASPKTDEFALQTVRNLLKEIVHAPGAKSISDETRIVHFVGPTGVGKTTTIAKLAAEQVLKKGRKVGFITADTYRIAAVEQLKTYATILNVPLEVVFSHHELTRAFDHMAHCDIVFMDTAGRNFRNPMYVSELNALLQAKGGSETFLVLGLTSKYKDMKAITGNFAKFGLDKVLFTKLDETETYGSIVNLLYEFPLRLSYITNGQNVPDDIAEANEDRLIELLLKER